MAWIRPKNKHFSILWFLRLGFHENVCNWCCLDLDLETSDEKYRDFCVKIFPVAISLWIYYCSYESITKFNCTFYFFSTIVEYYSMWNIRRGLVEFWIIFFSRRRVLNSHTLAFESASLPTEPNLLHSYSFKFF